MNPVANTGWPRRNSARAGSRFGTVGCTGTV